MKKAALWIAGALLVAAFFWTVVLKILIRIGWLFKYSAPCPASLSWIVDNPLRRHYMKGLMDRIGILPGEHVLELGPGPGTFTVEAAIRAGKQGRLTAVDIQPEMIEQVNLKIRKAGLHNVTAHVAGAYELPLPDSCIDRVYLVTVMTEIPDKDRAMKEIKRVLKPGGILSLTEEFLDPDYPFSCETVRLAKRHGFRLEKKSGNFWIYTLNFRKD